MFHTNQSSTYEGFWIDWTEGNRVQGATLTLSHRNGALLQSFTAIFTTFVFAQLWSIVTFALYHARSTKTPEDGLKHQQQVVLRNTGALATTVIFARQIFCWRGKAEKAAVRSLGWAALALGFAAAGGLASTFSGYAASKSSLNRLVVSNNCGYTTYTDATGHVSSWAYTLGTAGDAITAANYARTCYDGKVNSSDECKRYIQPRLSWTATYNTSCPFASGICSNGDQASFTMVTEPIDSLTGLGINSPPSERLSLQKRMTCSSIREINYYNQVGDLVYYNFGPIFDTSNFTFVYNRLALDTLVTYTLSGTYSYADFASSWSPIQALNRTDADVSIVFISSNTVIYAYPNNDPVFSATKYLGGMLYSADYDVSTLACAEQYQICNPAVNTSNNTDAGCTPWMGAAQMLFQTDYLQSAVTGSNTNTVYPPFNHWTQSQARLTARQLAILQRIAYVLPFTSTYNAIATRRASALRLQDTLSEFLQTQNLPDDYWTSEVGWWFNACLARLQEGVLAFATGPTDATVDSNTTLLADKETQSLCKNQLTRDIGSSTVNFSTLALLIIYCVGVTIIGLSLSVDSITRLFCAKYWPQWSFKTKAWKADGFLHLHRGAFVAAGHVCGDNGGDGDGDGDTEDDRARGDTWTSDGIPVTKKRGKWVHFSGITSSPTSYACLSPGPKLVGNEDHVEKQIPEGPKVVTHTTRSLTV